MAVVLLDASALIALMRRERGWERVDKVITAAAISVVNLAEVISHFVHDGVPVEEILEAIEMFKLEQIPFTYEQVVLTGVLRGSTRHLGLSLGDRVCLAAGICEEFVILTADRSWRELNLGVKIDVFR